MSRHRTGYRRLWIAVVVVLAGVSLLVAGATEYGRRTAAGQARFVGQTVQVAQVPSLPGVTVMFRGSGLFRVPEQIAPGTYQVAVNGKSLGCGWARKRAFDDAQGSVIRSDNINAGSSQLVTVEAGDRAFRLRGDCLWERG